MRRAAFILTAILPLILLSAVLAVPATANADLYLSKQDAKRATRQVVRDRYANEVRGAVYTDCDPWKATYDPAYDYRRWSCAWAAESEYEDAVCGGLVRVIGHRNAGGFYYRITHGIECF